MRGWLKVALGLALGALAGAALCSCQAPAVAAPQMARQDSGSPQAAPVGQERAMVYAPVFITGSGTIGHDAHARVSSDGDVRSAESQRTGALTSTPTQTTSQSTDFSGIGEAVAAILDAAAPGSEAFNLAKSALKEKDPAKAKALLEQAKTAKTTAPPPGG